jgi:hypothetical protein
MHKIILKKFTKEKKKLSNKEYNISDIYLYEILWNKNINDRQKISGFILNVVLNIFSTITIIKCKILKIQKLNYMVAPKNGPTNIDSRSKNIIDKIDLFKCVNLIRNKGFVTSIILYFKYPNIVFYSGIESIFISFKKNLNLKKISRYKNYHKNILKVRNFLEKIFLFLNIKKILMIDDNRVYPIFLDICKKNNIKTFGYMHYKFSKYFVCIPNYEFDNFLVWSDYFKKLLIKLNKNYKKKYLFYSNCHFTEKSILPKKLFIEQKIGILYIFDMDFDFEIFKELYKSLDKNKYALYLKFKPQNNIDFKYKEFCKINNIIFFENENLVLILKNYQLDFFVSCVSTMLLDASVYNAIPLKIKTSNDFFDDTIKHKVVIVLNPNKFHKINIFLASLIDNRNKIVNKIRKKTWNISLKDNNIDRFCKKFNA